MEKQNPKLMTIPQIARTGLLTVTALRTLQAENQLPSIKIRSRTYVNYDLLLKMLDNLDPGGRK